MRFSYVILPLLFLFVSITSAFAQIEPPRKKPFNIGVFTGLGGLNFSPIPGVDVQYKGTILRLAPGYRVVGAGISQEITKISQVFYNGNVIVSGYYARGLEESTLFDGNATFNRYIGMAGIRFYFANRFYSSFQGGTMVSYYPGHSEMNEVIPYFEFSIGVNIFRNYLPKPVE